MCGFSGIFRWDAKPIDRPVLKKMTDTLYHRGPDDEGFYFSNGSKRTPQANVGLGFRRLSIIDLEGGHQPMSTKEKNSWIVFNGEIYNFSELRGELEAKGCEFQTRSDTEVILHLYEMYGKECVLYLRGMFAFAIWDWKRSLLFLARDRVGKKPLFYARANGSISFASEMKALLENPEVKTSLDLESASLYFAYQFIPSPKTIFREIQKLPPAHTLTCSDNGEIHLERYWSAERKQRKISSIQDLAEELRFQLKEATKIRLVSDVPLGAFLSGGIDSSAVVGMMAHEMKEPVKTFSIGFDESDFSEVDYARRVASHFKTEHREFIVKPDTVEILPKLVWHYDQPFADPSALPSYYVARETRKFVTVALNGDGGDENFGGYQRYRADQIFYMISRVPKAIRSIIASQIESMPQSFQKSLLMRRLYRAGRALDSTPQEFNFKIFCYFDQGLQNETFQGDLLQACRSHPVYDYFGSLYHKTESEEFMEQVLRCDMEGYLPDCLLVKMDVASMANSLETRSPFLDHKLIEFASQIPSKYKVKLFDSKWILKQSLKGFLPQEILDRKKMGFGVPLPHWFRGPLKNYLRENLLSAQALSRGYFNKEKVEQLIQEHHHRIRDHSYRLWALLMFELWHQVFIDKSHRF